MCACVSAVRIRGLHKGPTPITIRSRKKRRRQGEEQWLVIDGIYSKKALFYMFLKHLAASAKRRVIRQPKGDGGWRQEQLCQAGFG